MGFLKRVLFLALFGAAGYGLSMLCTIILAAIGIRIYNPERKKNAVQLWFFLHVSYWCNFVVPVWYYFWGSMFLEPFAKIFSIILAVIITLGCLAATEESFNSVIKTIIIDGRSRGWLWYCAWMCFMNAARLGDVAQSFIDVGFDYTGFGWARWIIMIIGLVRIVVLLSKLLRMYKEYEIEISKAKTERLMRFR